MLQRYLKNTDRVILKDGEEPENPEDPSVQEQRKKDELKDTTLSRNPKLNLIVAQGFAKQIQISKNLIEFKLTYWRLAPNAWKALGMALGQNSSLQTLRFHACALCDGDNMSMLFRGQSAEQPRQTETARKLPQKNDSVLKLDLCYDGPASTKKQGL